MAVAPASGSPLNLGSTAGADRGRSLRGTVRVPGDKSISHRALLFGAIAEGETRIEGLLPAEDPLSTAACLRAMGVTISPIHAGETVLVQGVGLDGLTEPDDVLDCGNSGTTMRLMLGLLAGRTGRHFVLNGDASLRGRPMARVSQPLTGMGALIRGRAGGNLAPLAIEGCQLHGAVIGTPVASAQVKSALDVGGDMGRMICLHPGASLRGLPVVVPGDISSAAFWLVAAAITPGAEITVENVGLNPTRTGILEVLEQMEARLEVLNPRDVAGEPVGDVRVSHGPLKAFEIGGDLIPRLVDEIPILAVAACCAEGVSRIRDAEELRVKETDRLAVMARQLRLLGASLEETADGLVIEGGRPLHGAEVDSETDHRVAMSLGVAAQVAGGTTRLHRSEAAAVSYPGFWEDLSRLQADPGGQAG